MAIDKEKNIYIKVKFTRDEHEELKKLATKENISLSKLIYRLAIKQMNHKE